MADEQSTAQAVVPPTESPQLLETPEPPVETLKTSSSASRRVRARLARRMTAQRSALNPVLDAIHELVDHLRAGHEDRPVQETTLWLVLVAMGDSLLGAEMAGALGLDPGKARETARRALLAMTALGEGREKGSPACMA